MVIGNDKNDSLLQVSDTTNVTKQFTSAPPADKVGAVYVGFPIVELEKVPPQLDDQE